MATRIDHVSGMRVLVVASPRTGNGSGVMFASGQCSAAMIALATAIDAVKLPPMFPPLTAFSSAPSTSMILVPDWVPSSPVEVAARSPTPLIVTAATPSVPSVLNSFAQAAALPALLVTVTVMGTPVEPRYEHELLPPAEEEAV
jgi:hypothetical protein